MENIKLEKFKSDIKDKKVAVLGIGISNIPAIKYLVGLGADVTAMDRNSELPKGAEVLKELNINIELGKTEMGDLDKFDYILRSPGVKPFIPGIENAVKAGVILTSEIELLIELAPCKVIGVTGSDGKTTTTTLISKFLEKAGYKVWLGGNIGLPIFSKLDEIKSEDIIVVELSSFQLMTMKKTPDISVITNVSPNHLDYHRSFDEYVIAKANIFLNQEEGSILVLNKDNEFSKKYIDIISKENIHTNIREFSVVNETRNGVYLKEGSIVSNINGKEEEIAKTEVVRLVGIHNIANICAASSAVVDLTGTVPIKEVISEFGGVEHRMEFVRSIDGVKWYNGSIASSPTRTIADLNAFNQKIILIAGGYDKKIPYDIIGKPILDKVKLLILVGDTAPKIEEAVLNEAKKQNVNIGDCLEIVNFKTMNECVSYANKYAKHGDVVALSPASASFDMYKNFEERGNYFKKLVSEL